MAIAMNCPSCKHAFEFDDALNGKRIKCKHCGEAFRIEAAKPALPPAPKPTPPLPKAVPNSTVAPSAPVPTSSPAIVASEVERSVGEVPVSFANPRVPT